MRKVYGDRGDFIALVRACLELRHDALDDVIFDLVGTGRRHGG